MLRAVVADLHVGERPDDLDRFRALCRGVAAAGAGEVAFLGDLFRTLVGFEKFWDATVRAGLAELGLLRAAGVRTVLVEGNRDFYLDSRDLDPYRDVAGSVHSFVAGGRRFLLEHGDLVNSHDRLYRFWRAVSKSGAARAWAHVLPRWLARRVVRDTERRLSRTNFSYRRSLPTPDLERSARRHFAAGVDYVLWGHFHRTWALEEEGREARTLAAWADTGTVAWVAGSTGQVSLESPRW